MKNGDLRRLMTSVDRRTSSIEYPAEAIGLEQEFIILDAMDCSGCCSVVLHLPLRVGMVP